MTPEIKRSLNATDLSENAAYAFGYATSLAKKYNAEITILNLEVRNRKTTSMGFKLTCGFDPQKEMAGRVASRRPVSIRLSPSTLVSFPKSSFERL